MHNRRRRAGFAAALTGALAAGVAVSSPVRAGVIGPVDLGLASDLKIAVFGISSLQVSSSQITGHVGAGPGATPVTVSSSTIDGSLYHDPASAPTVFGSANVVGGLDTTQALATAVADLQQAAAVAAGLAPTQSLPDIIMGQTTIGGGESVNVVEIANITLLSGDTLTLSPGPGEVMILNVERLTMTGDSRILLDTGITTSQVLFNVANQMTILGSATLSGGYLCVTCASGTGHHGGLLTGLLYANAPVLGSGASVAFEWDSLPALVIAEPARPALLSILAVLAVAGFLMPTERRRAMATA